MPHSRQRREAIKAMGSHNNPTALQKTTEITETTITTLKGICKESKETTLASMPSSPPEAMSLKTDILKGIRKDVANRLQDLVLGVRLCKEALLVVESHHPAAVGCLVQVAEEE